MKPKPKFGFFDKVEYKVPEPYKFMFKTPTIIGEIYSISWFKYNEDFSSFRYKVSTGLNDFNIEIAEENIIRLK